MIWRGKEASQKEENSKTDKEQTLCASFWVIRRRLKIYMPIKFRRRGITQKKPYNI
jgi:hypothetical protein